MLWLTARCSTFAAAVVVLTAATLSPAAGSLHAAQVPERDRLLKCFYDARERNFDEARSCLVTLLASAPADVQALLELGFFEIAQKRDAAAIEALNRAVAAGSTRADVRAQLGYLHLARGERELALAELQAAVAIEPLTSNGRCRWRTCSMP